MATSDTDGAGGQFSGSGESVVGYTGGAGWDVVPVALLAYMQQDRREDGTDSLIYCVLPVEYRTQPLAAWQCQASELFAEALRAGDIVTANAWLIIQHMVQTYAGVGNVCEVVLIQCYWRSRRDRRRWRSVQV